MQLRSVSTVAARCIAAGAAALSALGAVAIILAVGALPHPWTTGYVSEAGVATDPRSSLYRLGILALCGGLILLGLTFGAARAFVLAGLLTGAGALGTVSAAVTCSPGCPLPPYEHSQPRDLIHAAASCLTIGLIALAMLALTRSGSRTLGRLAWVGSAIVVPLIAALGICLLAIGRGTTTAVLERLVLATLAIWVIIVALALSIMDGEWSTSVWSGRDHHGWMGHDR